MPLGNIEENTTDDVFRALTYVDSFLTFIHLFLTCLFVSDLPLVGADLPLTPITIVIDNICLSFWDTS